MDMPSSASNPFKLVKIITLRMLCQGRIEGCVESKDEHNPRWHFPFYSLPCLTVASALFLMPRSIFRDVVKAIGSSRKRLLPSAFLRPR